MVSAFLNICPPMQSNADYFMEVLKYFGKAFKSDQMAIVQGEFVIFPSQIPQPHGLVVLDVYLPNINAAANVSQYEQIRILFSNTYDKLCEIRDNYDDYHLKQAILNCILS